MGKGIAVCDGHMFLHYSPVVIVLYDFKQERCFCGSDSDFDTEN